ncbi:MAG: response regulator, partial [Deltaproteobacteria bacterium]
MAPRTASNKAEPLNILVIDDDADLRQMFERLFNGEQHQVVLSASAEEGLQLLPHWTFHIAFVDHRLPGMDGLVLGEYLRRNNPDMSIVMMTLTGAAVLAWPIAHPVSRIAGRASADVTGGGGSAGAATRVDAGFSRAGVP